ncbi:MAG TPA: SDR family NAD(P)-dependent oxidoreductase, partial [Bacteroidetes bacterium]|nr:SDR family NAD(P)-dependent oxidoreductase [Bacteroidota bacterium]
MSLELFDLTGKVALITGASHGLGMAIAKGLAKAGATIVVNGRSAPRLEKAKKEYAKDGIKAHTYVFDVTKEDQVIASLEKIVDEVGEIDILVNNAGIIKRIPIVDMDVEEFREVLDVDLVGPFIMAKHVAKSMIERKSGGKIININSM